ncbi:YihY/virulence factor BrkB family protein [Alkaliphilus peptidifermentans]|uniref:Membrane protein n=1 Tax=Alkaliphilus peptidifermentans DSM 18978 TaxID=1120976 RepID=A0A1G5ADV5_9FIRM|nr:YihY/virulence factor BrkB family protein [Alkaliphilus peptidifermentans]SCX76083.1 membrane protein [Alkaliphilus peptidifermentans DSM 18978]
MMIINFKSNKLYKLFKELYQQFQHHEVPALGAQVTFYLILSFFPFLIFLITLISYTPLTSEATLESLLHFLPYDAYVIVLDIVQQIVGEKSSTILSVGMITTFFVASNGVGALIRGINKSYGLQEKRPFWKKRGLAILFTIALSVVILFSLILLVFGQILANFLISYFSLPDSFKLIWFMIRYILSLTIMWFVFVCFYRYAPEVKPKFKNVLFGATFTTIGWFITSYGFSTYVNHFGNYANTYGSIGGVIVLLMWLYISSIIILTGAEVNSVTIKSRKKPDAFNTKNISP